MLHKLQKDARLSERRDDQITAVAPTASKLLQYLEESEKSTVSEEAISRIATKRLNQRLKSCPEARNIAIFSPFAG